jgi:hypothetical protein
MASESELDKARRLALEALDHAERLAGMWPATPWSEIRKAAEELFPFLAEANRTIRMLVDLYPDGAPEIIKAPKVPTMPDRTGREQDFKKRAIAHQQAVQMLTSIVARIDKGGVVSQSPEVIHNRDRPVPVELPQGWEQLREHIERERKFALPF